MASFEDYDEFGNYIGADLESDEEEDIVQDPYAPSAPSHAPLEGYDDDEPTHHDDSLALMEVEGTEDVNVNLKVIHDLS